jgi:SAM-dependent methyltransferase
MTGSTKRFSNRVDYYVRSRPKYPAGLLRFFQSELALSPAHVVADIGSGTGFLTELFVHNGNVTFAVEPNAEMRLASEMSLGQWSNFRSVNATAEHTKLADRSVDFVTAGQAFHWFEPIAARWEFSRILKPGGFVALIWNERQLDASESNRAYQLLIEKYQTDPSDCKRRSTSATEGSAMVDFFGAGGFQTRTFDNPQVLDRAGLLDRIASSSYMPLPGQPIYAELERDADRFFEAYQQNAAITFAQETRVFFGRL